MAEAITITCPECDKKINVPADAVGKKIRCKGCEHVFVIPAPAGKKAAKPAAKAAPAAAKADDAKKKAPGPKPAADKPEKPKADDVDEDGNPYGVTALDNAPRCPDCANEMESEDAVICLHCGYNTRTRSKVEAVSVEDVTGMTWFLWLLPGILCAVFTLLIFTFAICYSCTIQGYFIAGAEGHDSDVWYKFMGDGWFQIWCIWAPSILAMAALGTIAVKRLVYNPRPPERVKAKQKKKDE